MENNDSKQTLSTTVVKKEYKTPTITATFHVSDVSKIEIQYKAINTLSTSQLSHESPVSAVQLSHESPVSAGGTMISEHLFTEFCIEYLKNKGYSL